MASSNASRVIHMDDHRPDGPQLENGFVRVANELEDALLFKIRTFRHSQVVRAIIRKTYGYGKKEDDITISQIAEMTGLHRNHVGKAVKELEAMRVLNAVRAGKHGLILGINKHHQQWTADEVKPRGAATNLVDDGSNQNSCDEQPKQLLSATNLVDFSNQNVAHNRQPQKTTPKDNSKSIARSADRAAFAEFWEAFGYKNGKAKAEQAFHALLAASADPAATLAAVLAGAKKEAARRPFLLAKGATPMYAQGWLAQRRFEDESLLAWGEFSAEQQAFIDCYNANIGEAAPRVAEWSERTAALIDVARAGAWGQEQWAKFWRYVSDECEFRWPVSIDWLLTRENFAKVRGGQYERVEA